MYKTLVDSHLPLSAGRLSINVALGFFEYEVLVNLTEALSLIFGSHNVFLLD